jgi:hypothetical protein
MTTRFMPTLLIATQIIATSLAFADTCLVDPINPAGRKQWCGCPTSSSEVGAATVIDLSTRVTDRLLRAARERGVTTVFRYYDWNHAPDESIKLERQERWRLISSTCQAEKTCDKVVTREEIEKIHSYNMNVAIVFQHFSFDLDTWFDKQRPYYDADRAIDLARTLGQPAGSAIFFGVDGADENFLEHGDATAGMHYIQNYFHIVSDRVTKAGYVVGVYGSGLACDQLIDGSGSAPRWCWLSMSTGHPNSQAREASGKWTIKQCADRANFLGTLSDVDPDVLKNPTGRFGQW